MLVPPRITAAMACSSIPCPAAGLPQRNARRGDDRGETRGKSGEGEGCDLDAVRPDAREHRSFLVAANGEHAAPERGSVQQERQDQREDHHDPDRDEDAGELAPSKPDKRVETNGDQPPVGDDDGDSLEDQAGGDGGEEGVHPQRRDHHAVDDAERKTDKGARNRPR